jgi:hypothetical protein
LCTYVDLLLYKNELLQARLALEDFILYNPNMLKVHEAYYKFLIQYKNDDHISKCKAAARIFILGK